MKKTHGVDLGLVFGCALCQQNKQVRRSWFCDECFTEQEEERANWQAQAERAADARSLAAGERNSMQATITEQKAMNDDLAFRTGTFMAERDQARRFAEVAAQKYNDLLAEKRVLRCAFCNFEYPEGTPPTQHEALTQHIRECQSHPYQMEIVGLKWEVMTLRTLLRRMVEMASWDETMPEAFEKAREDARAYLTGVPQTEVEP